MAEHDRGGDDLLDRTVDVPLTGTDAELTNRLPDGWGYVSSDSRHEQFMDDISGGSTPPGETDDGVHTVLRETDDGTVQPWTRDDEDGGWMYSSMPARPDLTPQERVELVPKVARTDDGHELEFVRHDANPDALVERPVREVADGNNPAGRSADRVEVKTSHTLRREDGDWNPSISPRDRWFEFYDSNEPTPFFQVGTGGYQGGPINDRLERGLGQDGSPSDDGEDEGRAP